MELCRCSYVVMGILRAKDATNKARGLTINEIHELERTSRPNTIHKKVKIMEALGLIKAGAKVGKAKSYFITENGLKELPDKNDNKEDFLDEK